MGCGASDRKSKKEIKYPLKFIGSLQPGNMNQIVKTYLVKEVLVQGQLGKVYFLKPIDKDIKLMMTVIDTQNIVGYDSFRLENEINIINELDKNDNNIVKIQDGYTEDGTDYLITEYVYHDPILTYLDKNSKLTEYNLSQIIGSLAETLNKAHSKGIMHRNLRLQCVLLDPQQLTSGQEQDNQPNTNDNMPKSLIKLIDWSSGTKFQQKEWLSEEVSHIFYAAPQIFKNQYNQKIDVWALGMLTYLLIFGKLPYTGQTQAEIEKQVRESKFTTVLSESDLIWQSTSNQLRVLLGRMLTSDLSQRPSMKEILEDQWFGKVSIENSPPYSNDIQQVYQQNLQSKLGLRNINQFLTCTGTIKSLISSLTRLAQEEQSIKLQFEKLDLNRDGQINKNQLFLALRGFKGMTDYQAAEIVDQLFDQVDMDQNGHINIDEFLKLRREMNLNQKGDLTKETMKKLDDNFDNTVGMLELVDMMAERVDERLQVNNKDRVPLATEKVMDTFLQYEMILNMDDYSQYDDNPIEQYFFYEVTIEGKLGEIYNIHHALVLLVLKNGTTLQAEVGPVKTGDKKKEVVMVIISEFAAPRDFFDKKDFQRKIDGLTVAKLRDHCNKFTTFYDSQYSIRKNNCFIFADFLLKQFTSPYKNYAIDKFYTHIRSKNNGFIAGEQIGTVVTGGSTVGGLIGAVIGGLVKSAQDTIIGSHGKESF